MYESFTNGMLYVVLSRVASTDSLTLFVREDRNTCNVVYSEIFSLGQTTSLTAAFVFVDHHGGKNVTNS